MCLLCVCLSVSVGVCSVPVCIDCVSCVSPACPCMSGYVNMCTHSHFIALPHWKTKIPALSQPGTILYSVGLCVDMCLYIYPSATICV